MYIVSYTSLRKKIREFFSFCNFAKEKKKGGRERKKNKLNLRIIKTHLYSFQFFNRSYDYVWNIFLDKQKSKSFGKLRIDSKRTFEEDLFLLKSFRKKRLENVYLYHLDWIKKKKKREHNRRI